MQVERTRGQLLVSGERLSNTYVTCPPEGDNPGKLGLIPHDVSGFRSRNQNRKALEERRMTYQLVGEVTAHQGDDG